MGGVHGKGHEHIEQVDLCDDDHMALHRSDWVLSIDSGVATGSENGMVTFERGLTVQDNNHDSRFWSDQKLAQHWTDGEDKAQDGFEMQCNAAYEFHRRYRGNERWYERVAEIISENSGEYIHPREVYRRIDLYVAFHDDWTTYRRLGKTLALAVAESGDVKSALEIANVRKDEGGHTATEIVREIRGQEPPEPRRCPNCNWELGR